MGLKLKLSSSLRPRSEFKRVPIYYKSNIFLLNVWNTVVNTNSPDCKSWERSCSNKNEMSGLLHFQCRRKGSYANASQASNIFSPSVRSSVVDVLFKVWFTVSVVYWVISLHNGLTDKTAKKKFFRRYSKLAVISRNVFIKWKIPILLKHLKQKVFKVRVLKE